MTEEFCTPDCSPSRCDDPFTSVIPYPTVAFGTKVTWALRPDFLAKSPYVFQLQVGGTNLNSADDWTDVGTEVTDGYYAYDDVQRVFGMNRWTSYRVKLVDADDNTYYSRPRDVTSFMRPVNRNRVRAIQRFWSKKATARSLGTMMEVYVLKRRHYGTACPTCLDYQLGESTDVNCPTCYGTSILGGYFDPEGCVFAEPRPSSRRTHVDPQLQRGTLDDNRITVTMLADPRLMENDAIVVRRTDERYYVHDVRDVAMIEGVAVLCDVTLHLAPYSDVLYQFSIAAQIP